jgi:anhydro-N-acetylmuramic acid kinase
MKSYHIIGLMSGTSLDGLDIAYVKFTENEQHKKSFQLIKSETIKYPKSLIEPLVNAFQLNALQLMNLDVELGVFYAKSVLTFIKKNNLNKKEIDLISSHGQTIFHQPEKGLTVQIGNGEHLAGLTGIKTVTNFRMKDVVFKGQGAPLVPIGDFDLFASKAQSFLNIGGFCNISFKNEENKIIAFDICPGNLPLNKLANHKGLSYDKNGELAKTGEINFFLLNLLNELDYYQQTAPKSLGSEWLENHFYPLVKFDRDIENNLRTVIEHIASQISNTLKMNQLTSVLISGGGAHNAFLIERIKHYYKGEIILPSTEIIDFKEAIVFAYLGLLRLNEQVNCISSVTGAKKNVCGGILHLP